jgi:hypothetical protein
MGSKEDYLWAKYIGRNEVLLGIYWKTHWELGKPIGGEKKSPKNATSPTLPKRKQIESIWMHVTILHWLNKYLFPTRFITCFGLGYIDKGMNCEDIMSMGA